MTTSPWCKVSTLRSSKATSARSSEKWIPVFGKDHAQRKLLHVDHLSRHTAVDGKVRSGDETGAFAVKQPRHHVGDVLRAADAPRRMLGVVLAPQLVVVARGDPARADAVHPHRRKTHGERVRQRH